MALYVQFIGRTLFGAGGGLPSNIVQVALAQDAGTISKLKSGFPASGNAVGTANTGCSAGNTTQASSGGRKMV